MTGVRHPGRDQEAYDRFAAAVDTPLLVVSILWLPVLIIPLVSHPSTSLSDALDGIDYTVWALFAVEYLTKLYLAPHRLRFVRSHLVDLVVIAVPFLRPLRLARLLRLLRLARVVTTAAAVLRRGRSVMTHRGLHFVLLAVTILVFVLAGAELAFERVAPGANIHDYGDALWWAVVTATTVGYGDRYPVTAAGRGVAVILMLVGIGLVGVVTATVASYFIEQRQREDPRLAVLEERLARMESMLEELVSVHDDHRDPKVLSQATRVSRRIGVAVEDHQSVR